MAGTRSRRAIRRRCSWPRAGRSLPLAAFASSGKDEECLSLIFRNRGKRMWRNHVANAEGAVWSEFLTGPDFLFTLRLRGLG